MADEQKLVLESPEDETQPEPKPSADPDKGKTKSTARSSRTKKQPKKPEVKQSNSAFKEREVTIKVNPHKLMIGGIVVVALLVVFFLGRLTAPAAVVEEVVIEQPEEVSSGFIDSFLALFESAAAEADEVVEAAVEEVAEAGDELTGAVVAEEEPVEEAAEEEPEELEPVEEELITTYSNVALNIDNLHTKWFDNWGKITGIDYTIKNNEAGMIKPHRFLMLVDGYDDLEKDVPVSYKSEKISAGETHVADTAVPNGFAYNPASISLDNVVVTLILYDGAGKKIASTTQGFNLE